MSDDLVKRLRGYGDGNNDLMDAAAARIERLEAALREFATCACISNCDEKNGRVCELWACRKALDAK